MGTAAVRRTSRRGTCVKRYGLRSTLTDDDYDEVLSHRGGAGERVGIQKQAREPTQQNHTESHYVAFCSTTDHKPRATLVLKPLDIT